MAEIKDKLTGDPNLYKAISLILTAAFILNAIVLLTLNISSIEAWFDQLMGERRSFFIQLFFWGTTGATIAGSVFMANDKEINELERVKDRPDPTTLRYPNEIDVWLYVQRILSSGFLALFGAAFLFAGLGYFDVSIDSLTAKHRVFLIVFCFLIGLFENRFLETLNTLSKRLFEKHASN
jgi:hypothetical protein